MADTYWSNVSLLTHCDGTNGSVPVDQKGKTITSLNSAGVSTAQFKFGTGCLELNGTNQGVTVANSADFSFGSGNFTVEMFAKFDEIAATKFLLFYGTPKSWWVYRTAQSLQVAYSTDGTNSIAMPSTANVITSTAAWYHIALVRNGSALKLYVDGIERSALTVGADSFYNTAGALSIGTYNNGFYTDGRFDEIRITKGVARYTAGFSPPTAAFPDTGDEFSAAVDFNISLLVEGVADHPLPTTSADGDFGVTLLVEGVGSVGIAAATDFGVSLLVECTGNHTTPGVAAIGDFGLTLIVESSSSYGAVAGVPPFYDQHWSNVGLLLHCDGSNGGTTFTDEKGKTVTPFGGVTTATSAAKFGATGMLGDGVGTYLSIPNHADFDFGSGDFTFECWINPTSVSDSKYNQIVSIGTTTALSVSQRNGVITFYARASALNSAITTAVVQAGVWSHIACVRNGSLLKVYVNGVERASGATSGTAPVPNTDLFIGQTASGVNFFGGGLDEIRLTKGVARYTSTPFTPPALPFGNATSTFAADIDFGFAVVVEGVVDALPAGVNAAADISLGFSVEGVVTYTPVTSAPDPDWSNVSFLLHCDGDDNGAVFTESTGKTVTTVGTVKTFISSAKFGFTGVLCDGGGYLTTPNHAGFDFGSGDFTIELWVRPSSIVGISEYLIHNGSPKSFAVRRSNRIVTFSWSTTGADSFQIQTGHVLSADVWSHIACVRSGTAMKIYVDGVESASGTQAGSLYTPTTIVEIGASNGVSMFAGSMDEIRVTKGVARYTSTPFAPPTQAFPDASSIVSAIGDCALSVVVEGVVEFFDIKASADTTLAIQVEGEATYALPVVVTGDFSIRPSVEGEALYATDVLVDGLVYIRPTVLGAAYFGLLEFEAAVDAPIIVSVDASVFRGVVGAGDATLLLNMLSSAGRGALAQADLQAVVSFDAQCSHRQSHTAFADFALPLYMSCAAGVPVLPAEDLAWVKTPKRELYVYE